MQKGGGHWPSRFLAETKLADGALFDVEGFRNELTVECPGMIVSSPTRLVRFYLNCCNETDKSILVDLEMRLTSKVYPPYFVYPRNPLWKIPAWSMVILDPSRRKCGRPSKASGMVIYAGLAGDASLMRSSNLTVVILPSSRVMV